MKSLHERVRQLLVAEARGEDLNDDTVLDDLANAETIDYAVAELRVACRMLVPTAESASASSSSRSASVAVATGSVVTNRAPSVAQSDEAAASSSCLASLSGPASHVRFPAVCGQNLECRDASGAVCGHYCRTEPPLLTAPAYDGHDDVGGVDGELAVALLSRWLSLRTEAAALIAELSVQKLPWDLAGSAADTSLHDDGVWVRASLSSWRPRPPLELNVSACTLRGWPLLQACHATSMYTVASIVRNGMSASPTPGRGGQLGIYCFPMTSAKHAKRSAGYSVYSPLGDSDLFAAPRVILRCSAADPDTNTALRYSVGAGQWCFPARCVWVEAVFFHVVPKSLLLRGPRLWSRYDEWNAAWERTSIIRTCSRCPLCGCNKRGKGRQRQLKQQLLFVGHHVNPGSWCVTHFAQCIFRFV